MSPDATTTAPLPIAPADPPARPRYPLPMRLCGWFSRVAPMGRGTFHIARAARNRIAPARRQGIFRNPDGLILDLHLDTYPDFAMAASLYELDTLRVIRKLLRPGDRVVDAGANIGYFALHFARLVGPTGRVQCFEPDPLNRARLVNHLAWNRAADIVQVHPVAVGESHATLTLHHPAASEGNHGQATLFASLAPTGETFDVPVVPLDEFVPEPPRLIKMDIEGAELSAFKGMSNLLRATPAPAILFEHNPTTARAAGFEPGALFEHLLSLDPRWTLQQITRTLNPIRTPADLTALSKESNILAIRRD